MDLTKRMAYRFGRNLKIHIFHEHFFNVFLIYTKFCFKRDIDVQKIKVEKSLFAHFVIQIILPGAIYKQIEKKSGFYLVYYFKVSCI